MHIFKPRPRSTESETLEVGLLVCVLTIPLGDSDVKV